MDNSIKNKTSRALKWSSLGEIVAKIVTPISNMILARILTPEAFGVVATVTMIISFADTLSDSGFQKYLIQYDFDNNKQFKKSTDVAFTSNFIFSIFLWILIIIFNNKLATLVGNDGLGKIFIIAGISLIITSFSSIYSAILKRDFDYKKLFYCRIINAIVPFFVTIPLALLGWSYWALIVGTIAGNLISTILMVYISKIKLKIRFDISEFKKMFSFSMWSLLESIGSWVSSYIGTFIVGIYLSTYYLGLYKTTITSVNGIFAIVTSATTSVLFSALSRLQNDKAEYDKTYLNFINIVSIIIIPLGFGIYAYNDLVTTILLGNQWMETAFFVGIYGLLCSFTLVLGQYCSEYFRGLGKPKYNVIMTFFHLIALIPALLYSSQKGFVELSYFRSLVKLQQILVFWIIMYVGFKFNPFKILKKIWKSCASSILMFIIAALAAQVFTNNYLIQIISAIICVIIYFIIYAYVFKGKEELKEMVYMFSGKGGKVNE